MAQMEADEFRKRGCEMVEYVAHYLETIGSRQVFPDVSPGYLQELIPDHPPIEAEMWEAVKADIERVVMPGVTHWHSPHFHAYFPTANSYPSILADMLSDAIGCIGFSWASSPACTELEVSMMDWLAKMLQLPKHFHFCEGGQGGGVIQGTASEATLVALLSARSGVSKRLRTENPSLSQGQILDKLVAYCSEQAHSSVERASLISVVTMRTLPTDEKGSLRGETLEKAIKEDKSLGKIPFFLCATCGTTSICSFDNVRELGSICKRFDLWMHVDAAYAGAAAICPEFRPLFDGLEYADSFNFNPHKWMQVTFDCSAMWVKDRQAVSGSFDVDPLYLQHKNQGQVMPDYRHWQIPLGRRFRSLKLWFVMRLFGVNKLQEIVRKDVRLAKEFEALVLTDDRFEIVFEVIMGLVCFRLKGENELSEELNKRINEDRRIHLVPSKVKDTYFLRFAICATSTESSDVKFAWKTITEIATTLIVEQKSKTNKT